MFKTEELHRLQTPNRIYHVGEACGIPSKSELAKGAIARILKRQVMSEQ